MKTKTAPPVGQQRMVRPLRERTMRDIWPLANKLHGTVKIQALLNAANLASTYNCSSCHSHDLGDCILAKLNVLRFKVRRNPYRANDQALRPAGRRKKDNQ